MSAGLKNQIGRFDPYGSGMEWKNISTILVTLLAGVILYFTMNPGDNPIRWVILVCISCFAGLMWIVDQETRGKD